MGFDLRRRPALGRGDYYVSPANELALARIDAPDGWATGKLVLTGPPGAGKTHLAHVWAEAADARVLAAGDLAGADPTELARGPVAVDDADAAAGAAGLERALFHLFNAMSGAAQPFLMTARQAPAKWGVTLPDLASRLEATDRAALEPPDDALLAAVLMKLLADRQLDAAPDLIGYATARMPRSFAAAHAVAEALNREAFSRRKPLTKPIIRAVLDKLAEDG